MSRKPVALLWWEKSQEDEWMARRAMIVPELPASAAFHAQQAVEKAFKACLIAQGRRVEATHHLSRLRERLLATHPVIQTEISDFDCAILSRYAVSVRYPSLVEVTSEESWNAIALATRFCRLMRHAPESQTGRRRE